MDKNCLLRTDELHTFSDGTLNHVRTALNDIANGIQMDYLPKRKWSKQDKQRARVMINAIDKKIRDRWLMRSLEKLNTLARNPIKEILLKLNLPDHRIHKDGGEDKEFQRSFCHYDTERLSRSDEVLKLKNFKKYETLKLFKSTNQERHEHVGPEVTSSQDYKVYKMAKRDYAWLMISRCSRSHFHIQDKGTSSNPKSMITASQVND
ncbi:hypothetical protein Tco_0748224 [Tanacetum coccineum]|uniref:Uncharacterized protein n=1 Tax=Tanacetum coccineum TaxID=301880 RepID=A0ABQ4YYF4_9ASTR